MQADSITTRGDGAETQSAENVSGLAWCEQQYAIQRVYDGPDVEGNWKGYTDTLMEEALIRLEGA